MSHEKVTFQHTAHVGETIHNALLERAKSFRSINAYLVHCIRRDIEDHDQCRGCTMKESADSVLRTLDLARMVGRRGPEVSGRMILDDDDELQVGG